MYLDLGWNWGPICCRLGPSTFQAHLDYNHQVFGPGLHHIRTRFQRISLSVTWQQVRTSGNLATNSKKFLGNKWFKIETFDACSQPWALRNWSAVDTMSRGLINWFEGFIFTGKMFGFHRHDVAPPLAIVRKVLFYRLSLMEWQGRREINVDLLAKINWLIVQEITFLITA